MMFRNFYVVWGLSLALAAAAASGIAQEGRAQGEHVKALAPFVGYWVGEHAEEGGGPVSLSCRWVGNQSYLQMQVMPEAEGERQVVGTLLIGRDYARDQVVMWGFWPDQQVSGEVQLESGTASWTEAGTLPDGGKASADVVMKVEGDVLKVDVTKVRRGDNDGPEMHIVFKRTERRGRGGR